ncbi:LacI family transcriptional regulator [Tessaracoccus sp. HDW20]|uniref:LacI family DNA-binding transcriptional regulator n=1 Tax=Tessaracoccus coleopterorum TaxID=2714950 RepID=UPI0018D46632|nr:LacI family DNA-binding transcriptional regulator [Tessaracoccus coleopterorum]NHB84731.1 LacI family transcriptional regulator [Tessaracoccus coleopterorum]
MDERRREPTIADVALASGVSAATVSRVLNGHPKVAADLAERVQVAAREINYRPNGAGRALRRQRSDLLAAIVPDVRNPFFVRLVEAFETVANAEGTRWCSATPWRTPRGNAPPSRRSSRTWSPGC